MEFRVVGSVRVGKWEPKPSPYFVSVSRFQVIRVTVFRVRVERGIVGFRFGRVFRDGWVMLTPNRNHHHIVDHHHHPPSSPSLDQHHRRTTIVAAPPSSQQQQHRLTTITVTTIADHHYHPPSPATTIIHHHRNHHCRRKWPEFAGEEDQCGGGRWWCDLGTKFVTFDRSQGPNPYITLIF